MRYESNDTQREFLPERTETQAADETAASVSEDIVEARPVRDPTRLIAIGAVLLLALLVGWYALADRWTPNSSNGSTAAYVAQIAPRVAGQVTEVLVEDNAVVRAGQPVFRLDPTTLELDVATVEANRAAAEQQAITSSAAIRTAEAQVANARAQAASVRAENERIVELAESGAYSRVRVEQAKAAIVAADAAVTAAQADLARVRMAAGPQGDKNPAVRAAQSQLERAQQLAAYSEVTAPADGYITNLQLTSGQFLQAGTAGMTFIDPSRQWIIADFRENQLGNLDPGDPVEVLFDAAPGQVFRGRVESIAWGVSATRPVANGLQQPAQNSKWFEPARRIPVRIVLEEPWPAKVRIGSQASVTVHSGGMDNPLSWIAQGILRVQSVLSYLH